MELKKRNRTGGERVLWTSVNTANDYYTELGRVIEWFKEAFDEVVKKHGKV